MNKIYDNDIKRIREELEKNGIADITKWTYIVGDDEEGYGICCVADGDPLDGASSLEEAIATAKEIDISLECKKIAWYNLCIKDMISIIS